MLHTHESRDPRSLSPWGGSKTWSYGELWSRRCWHYIGQRGIKVRFVSGFTVMISSN